MHYYFTKYPYLQYPFKDFDGQYFGFSVPPELLVREFYERFKIVPKTFFDCGAATGEIVYRAEKIGLKATGIDIKKFPYQNENLKKLFVDGKIQIKSILDCEPIKADLVFCNGILTYLTESELPRALNKFTNCKMLVAIHNTTEDEVAAKKQGDILPTFNQPRLIKPNDWWIEKFIQNGFDTEYNGKTRCFYSTPKTR